jgi:hypothetical protein
MELNVDCPRPLAHVARLLEQRFFKPVTYEDIPYLYPPDLICDEAGRTIPRSGKIFVEYKLGDSPQAIIDAVLISHGQSANPGVFNCKNEAEYYHIAPLAFLDAKGKREKWHSLLETEISVPPRTRSGLEVLEDITRALSNLRNEHVALGTIPTNAFIQYKSAATKLEGPTGKLLMNLFRQMEKRLSWQFLNVPGKAEFIFNIHFVPE